jgi:peptidoglycan/xylan/chitin deacetylase (PgdA/CDA1 family)
MNGLYWKRIIGRHAPNRDSPNRKVILLYHALGPAQPAITPQAFSAQLQWLAGNAEVMSLSRLLDAPGSGLQVALTFDDGYASLHELAEPLMRSFGMCGMVYLNTAHIGIDKRQPSDPGLGHYPDQHFMTWHDVQALLDAGWSFGSHGVHHSDLARADLATRERELVDSRRTIEEKLQRPCEHFAFTWGRFNRGLQRQVRAAGYLSAASGLHGPLQQNPDRSALPRIDVRADYDLEDFIAVVTGRWDWLGLKQRVTRLLP